MVPFVFVSWKLIHKLSNNLEYWPRMVIIIPASKCINKTLLVFCLDAKGPTQDSLWMWLPFNVWSWRTWNTCWKNCFVDAHCGSRLDSFLDIWIEPLEKFLRVYFSSVGVQSQEGTTTNCLFRLEVVLESSLFMNSEFQYHSKELVHSLSNATVFNNLKVT